MGLLSSLPVLTPNYGDMPLSLFGGQVHDFDVAAHAAVPKGLKVHVSIFCSGCGEVTRFWTGRRQTAFKMQRGTRRWRQYASSGGQGYHLWLSQGLWPSSTPVAGADRTRPVSWLGSISFGAHPRTKGARCFTGGHRGRTPSSPKGLLASRAQGARRPFGPDVESADQQAVHPAGQESTFNPPDDTSRWRGTCHCRRRGHAWDAPRVAGPFLTTAGKRGWGRTCLAGVRKLWERSAACAKRLASHRTIRTVRCLYSQDNGCTTKKDRFCRCAAASLHHTMGKLDLRESGWTR